MRHTFILRFKLFYMKILKNSHLICLFFSFCILGNAAGQTPDNWQNLCFDDDGVYGACIDKAHAAAKALKSTKTVTVALIGYGIDVENKDIKNVIWVNPKEKPNGKDDDGNGLTDDLHGWNFLGNSTTTLNNLSHEGDREFLRLKDKYAEYIIVVDNKAYKYDSTVQALVETAFPENAEEFMYFRSLIPESEIAQSYMGVGLAKAVVAFIHEAEKKLHEKFPDKELTVRDFESIADKRKATELEKNMFDLVALMFQSSGSDSWEKMREFADTKFVSIQQQQYNRMMKNMPVNERQIIGDNAYDLSDIKYGNNNLLAENAGYGTMLAGFVGAKPGNAAGIKGAAKNVKIMSLRVDAGVYGESYPKDVALAIRYAVDNGAEIIQLGRTNTLYPRPWAQWVDEALRYAEQKGVLIIIPMMDYSYNLDDQPFYPNRRTKDGELSNILTVAASDSRGNPHRTANFSKTQLDLFAPGVDVKSTHTGNTYAVGSGSVYAAALVSGVAAFIKSYYPEIAPSEMRKLLMDNVSKRDEAEVEKQFRIYKNGQKGSLVTDLFLFSDLCESGGILNAEKTFKAAGKLK